MIYKECLEEKIVNTSDQSITSPAIKRIRIKAWFRAVTEASGLSSGQLEAQFSPSSGVSKRSCIWDKYRRGETAPRQGVVGLVEGRYPGTQRWLYSPLWRMADHATADMGAIRDSYENLPKLIRSIFVEPNSKRASIFWRRQLDIDEVCEYLRRFGSVEALVAALTVIKEAEVIQDQYQHWRGVQLARQYLERFAGHPVLGNTLNRELRNHLELRWADPGYTALDTDVEEGQTFD